MPDPHVLIRHVDYDRFSATYREVGQRADLVL